MRDTSPAFKEKKVEAVPKKIVDELTTDTGKMLKAVEQLRLSGSRSDAMQQKKELDSLWQDIIAKSKKNPSYALALSDPTISSKILSSKGSNEKTLEELYANAAKETGSSSYHVGTYTKLKSADNALGFYDLQLAQIQLSAVESVLLGDALAKLTANRKELVKYREYQIKNGVDYSVANMQYDHSLTLQKEAELFLKIVLVNRDPVATKSIAESIKSGSRFDAVKELGIGFTFGEAYFVETDPRDSVLGRTTTVAEALIKQGKVLANTDWSRFSKSQYVGGNVFALTDMTYDKDGYNALLPVIDEKTGKAVIDKETGKVRSDSQTLKDIESLWSQCITSQKQVLDMNTLTHVGIMPESDFTLDANIRKRYFETKNKIYGEFESLVRLGSEIETFIKDKDYKALGKRVEPFRALRELAEAKKYKELAKLGNNYSEVIMLIWPEMHMMGSNRLANAITKRADLEKFNDALYEAELIPVGVRTVLSVAPEFVEPILERMKLINGAKDFGLLSSQIVLDARKGPDAKVDEAKLQEDLKTASQPIIEALIRLEKNRDFEARSLTDVSEKVLRAAIYKPIIFSSLVPSSKGKAKTEVIDEVSYDSFPISTEYFKLVLLSSKGKVDAETGEDAARFIVWQKVRSITLQFNTIFEKMYAKPTIDAGLSSFDYTVTPFAHNLKENRLKEDMKVMSREERVVPHVRAELDVFREARGDQISLNWKELDSIALDPKKAGFKLKGSTKAKGNVAAVFAERGYAPETEVWEGKDGQILVRGFYKGKPVILTSGMDTALTRHREINVLLGEENPKREVSYRPGAKRYVKYAVEIDPDGPGYFKPPLKLSEEVFNTVDPLFEFAAAPPNAKKVSATVPALSGVALGTLETDHAIPGKLTAYQQQLEAIKRMFKDSSSYTAANMPVFESRIRAADQLLASAVAVTLNNITADPAHKLTQKDGSDLTPAQLGVLNNFVQSGRSDKAVRDAIRQTSLYRMIPSEEEMNAIISSVYNLRIFSVILKKGGATILPAWAPKGWTVIPGLKWYGVLLGDVVEQVQGSASINNTSFTPSGEIIGTQQTFSNDIALKQHAIIAGPELAVTSAGGTRLANINFATTVKGPLSIQLLNVTGAGAPVLNNVVHRFRTDLKRPWFGYFTDLTASVGEGINLQMMRVEKDIFIRLESNMIELPMGDYIRPVIPYFRGKSVPTFDLKISHIYEKQINKGLFGDDYVDKKSFAAISTAFNFEKFGVDAKPIFSLGGKTDLTGYRLNTWFGRDRIVEIFFEQRLNPGQDSYTLAFQYKFDGGALNDFDPYAWLKKKFEKKGGEGKGSIISVK